MMSRLRYWAVAFAVLGLAACNKAQVNTDASYYGPALPRPDHVLVSYFSVSPDQVRLDQGIAARIQRAAGDQPMGADQYAAAQATQAALAQRLVDRLRGYGLPAQIAPAYPMPGTKLLVQGQLVAIDQGNRTRRTLIGFGAGKSTVSADSQLYFAAGAEQPRFLTAFNGEADSGHMPGAAETMGAGAAAQRLATSAAVTGATHAGLETRRATDTAEADRLADALASRVGQFAVSQGWIPTTAIR
ncbi:MAG TPA: DUF4410 domain-containing protein [Rhodopila sp.]|uniref:DUF4410 domain-containing protein n=1 Tax=Rhodopila sp. TaxID=2480087 RepID=UPI002D0FEDB5|nr:DUF4410 domain-containing protein [Rhodopila sp.]HVY16247.1 DUF4410 domain-containing protein [Rhodopila sp.]